MVSIRPFRSGASAPARRFPALISFAALIALAAGVARSEPATPPAVLTPEQAVEEAIANNLGLLAERVNLTLAEAAVITARLRPNPIVSASADHLDLLGTGFSSLNNGGPPELAWRVDVPFERGHKRELRV